MQRAIATVAICNHHGRMFYTTTVHGAVPDEFVIGSMNIQQHVDRKRDRQCQCPDFCLIRLWSLH